MKSKKSSRKKRGGFSRRPQQRKVWQLCKQVSDALHFAFAGECNDDVLRDLGIVSVEPQPDESQLLVTVAPQLPGDFDRQLVTARLNEMSSVLKNAVAANIHRKKLPQLVFYVLTTPITELN